MSRATGLDRRRFLVVGGAVIAAAGLGLAATGCADGDEGAGGAAEDDGLASMVGGAAPAVGDLGGQVLEAGAYPDVAAARAALPTDGLVVVDGDVTVEDATAFAAAYQAAQGAELADGRLEEVAGFLFTPTELALAVAVHGELA